MAISKIGNSGMSSGAALSNLGSSQLADANMAPGSVIQVVSTIKNDRWSESVAAATWSSNITSFSATITPISSSSKILITFVLYRDSSASYVAGPRILQDGTVINTLTGDADGSRVKTTGGYSFSSEGRTNDFATGSYLVDAGSTSARTYTFQIYNTNASTSTLYVNRSGQYSNDAYDMLPCSSVVLMEIAG